LKVHATLTDKTTILMLSYREHIFINSNTAKKAQGGAKP
jgi:hypothetical protein